MTVHDTGQLRIEKNKMGQTYKTLLLDSLQRKTGSGSALTREWCNIFGLICWSHSIFYQTIQFMIQIDC